VLRAEGESFVAARAELERTSDQPIYLGAAQSLVFTEDFAKTGIDEYILRFRQLPEYRKTIFVALTPENPEEFLNVKTENTPSVGFAVNNMITHLDASGESFHFNMANLLATYSSPNKCFLLHTFGIEKDKIRIIGYSVFDGGTYIGFIPVTETKGIVMLKARSPKFRFVVPYSGGTVSVIIDKSNKQVKASYKDGNIVFDIGFFIRTQQLYPNKDVKINSEQKAEIEQNLQRIILDELVKSIRQSQAFACDYLEFYTVFRITYPEEAKQIDWKQRYPDAIFNIKVTSDLDLTGNIDYSEKKQ